MIDLINAFAPANVQINVSQRYSNYVQVSLNIGNSSGWTVVIKPTLEEALLSALTQRLSYHTPHAAPLPDYTEPQRKSKAEQTRQLVADLANFKMEI